MYAFPKNGGLCKKILPPNFRAAGFGRHLAKDSACGENSIARCKKPKRSRIRQSAAVRVSSTKVERKTDDRTPTLSRRQGIIRVRWAIPLLRSRHAGKRGCTFAPAGKYDARTVTLQQPRQFIILALIG
jgi:hypothetical protein